MSRGRRVRRIAVPSVASFVEAAKAALMAGEAAQAATVCRHLLAYFPKHVEANCLLAESLRDLGEIAPARDLYFRVISADPANLVAHWALGLIAEADGDDEWAAWELNRAWEIHPGHPELRGEILRVTGARPLTTPLGLAQSYAAAGLLDQAIVELRRALADEPARLDVAVVLAVTLWRADRVAESAEVCESILADSPDCLKATLLLGAYLAERLQAERGASDTALAGRESTRVLRLLERAHRLDPSGTVAAGLFGVAALPEILSQPTEIPALGDGVLESASPITSLTNERPAPRFSGQPANRDALTVKSDAAPWLQEATDAPQTVQAALESRLASAAAQRPEADWQALQSLDPSWQKLLAEDITLDDESESRLSSALNEAGLASGDKVGAGWVEVPTSAGGGIRLGDTLVQSGRPAAGQGDEQVPSQPAVLPAEPVAASSEPAPLATPDLAHATATWRAGDDEAALEEYRRLLNDQPDLADDVVESVRQLIEIHPDVAAAHRVLGDAYMRSGRFQQAIDEYNWVLANK
jgi:tetratricopeptide (TPR) repeat protein